MPGVLVLDDSAAQRKLLVTLLRRWGFEATACGDAEHALRLASDPGIGLIVSDWMMPGMMGPEFCRRLRASGRAEYQYVILLTSKSETADLSEGLAAGADDFLTKPVSPPELRARLNAGARIVAMQAELVEKTQSLSVALAKIRQLYDAIEKDLDEARRLQLSFLNDTHRRFAGADVSLLLKASGHVGGDMVGVFEVSRQVFGFYSMDVSGHGVAAGMLVARVAGIFRDGAPDLNIAVSSIGGGLFSPVPPDMVAAQLNAQILNEVKGERYLTLCLGFLDQRSGAVRMVQAGHPAPLVLRAGGTHRTGGDRRHAVGPDRRGAIPRIPVRPRCGGQAASVFGRVDGMPQSGWRHGGGGGVDGPPAQTLGLVGGGPAVGDVRGAGRDFRGLGFSRRRVRAPGRIQGAGGLAPRRAPLGKPAPLQELRHEMPVARDGKKLRRFGPGQEDGAVARFRRLRPARTEAGGVDVAELLRVKLVIRHVGEAVEHAETAHCHG
jgi:sigma-B regulation protein RsbU (phosphoserine phosphatase)